MFRPRIVSIAAAAGAAALITVMGASPSTANGVGVGGSGRPGPRVPGEITTHSFVAGEVCPFPVTIIDIVNETSSRTFPDGSSLSTGRLVERITNDETGEYVVRNISGPGASTYGPNGEWTLTLTGSSIFWIIKEIGDATGTLNEGLFIGHGPLVYVDLLLVQAPPRYENLCETLG